MKKEFSGKELKTPRGSLRSFSGLSPLLATVVMTFIFSDPSPFKSSVTCKWMLIRTAGAAETATAEAMRATRETQREVENIMMKVVKGAEEATPLKP